MELEGKNFMQGFVCTWTHKRNFSPTSIYEHFCIPPPYILCGRENQLYEFTTPGALFSSNKCGSIKALVKAGRVAFFIGLPAMGVHGGF